MSNYATRTAPQISLPAGSTTGTGAVLDNNGCCSSHTLVTIASAGVAAGTVQLQGSLDNLNWVNLGTAITLTASTVQTTGAAITGLPYQFIRASVGTAVSGGTVAAWVASA